MNIVNPDQITTNISEMITELNQSQEPILIQTSSGNAILISEQIWNDIQETLYLQSIPGMVESIHKEDATPLEECIKLKDIQW
jgi:PHD/YefM family antitoxin component YafN of YafNO toxin-antitoxin module